MTVIVQFHGILSDWVGAPSAEFRLPEGATLGDLYAAIRRDCSAKMPPQLSGRDPQGFHRALWALRGQERLAGLAVRLREGEKIQLFLTLAGG